MKGYLLPSQFGLNLAWIKVLGLAGGFLSIWLLYREQIYQGIGYGEPWVYWLVLLVLIGANFAVLSRFSSEVDLQVKVYQWTLLLDLIAIGYLTATHADLFMFMLLGLTVICGFYNFVMPREVGNMVIGTCLLVSWVSIFFGLSNTVTPGLDSRTAMAYVILGGSVLGMVGYIVRRIRRTLDQLYATTDELAFDLTSHAIDSYLAETELSEKHQEATTMLQVSQNIVSVLEWDQLFKNVIQAFRHRFKFDKFSIYLFNAEKGVLELSVESGSERASTLLRVMNPADGIVGWCFTQGRGVLVQDTRSDPRFMEISERGKRIRSLAAVPLIFRGHTLGVLCLDSEKVGSFDEKAFSFLERVAPLISIAASNSLTFTEAKEESFTDNLTGLKNHRGFEEIFLPLLSEAYTDDFSLALVIMDIDNFKKINDTYGHQVGNIILTELAKILREFFRASDLVARFGGEEFVVVLNGTPADIAPRIAEQLRRKVESHQFPISMQRDAFKQVTISLGLATTTDTNLQAEIVSGSRGRGEPDRYLRNAQELADLIVDNADQALYVAKREGKNQVRLSYQYPIDFGPSGAGAGGIVDKSGPALGRGGQGAEVSSIAESAAGNLEVVEPEPAPERPAETDPPAGSAAVS